MVHVVDSDDEMMWTDDHNPPMPTSQWKPGQTIEYTHTIFIPVYPYVGEASIQLGLYSIANQKRLPLAGDDAGQRAYRVGAAAAAAADREPADRVQGRLECGRGRRAQLVGRVAVDEEGRDAVVQEPEEGLRLLSRPRQPGRRAEPAAAGHRRHGRRARGPDLHAGAEAPGAEEDSDYRPPSSARRTPRSCRSASTRRSSRCRWPRRRATTRASWASACSMPSSTRARSNRPTRVPRVRRARAGRRGAGPRGARLLRVGTIAVGEVPPRRRRRARPRAARRRGSDLRPVGHHEDRARRGAVSRGRACAAPRPRRGRDADVPYGDIIDTVAAEQGVSARLVRAVIRAESAYQPTARSREGRDGADAAHAGHSAAVRGRRSLTTRAPTSKPASGS